ncbi:MAG: hypothetical protein HZA50_00475 [Planctomycetes bacterium]|nr:hypothetical protein [Planctomycetota bacterium]
MAKRISRKGQTNSGKSNAGRQKFTRRIAHRRQMADSMKDKSQIDTVQNAQADNVQPAASLGPAPTSRAELVEFLKNRIGITVPDQALCPNHNAPLDYLHAGFLDQHDLLVWANRGGGKTYLAAVATVLDAAFHAPSKIRVLGGSFDQSDRLADYIREIFDSRPFLADLLAGRMTRTRVRLTNGSEIRMLAQSQRAVRGQHVQKIRCDEVDLFDSQVWRAVQFITRSQAGARGSIEVLSTLHRRGGLMDKLVSQSLGMLNADGGNCKSPNAGYRLVKWCLWEVIERCPAERSCDRCGLAEDCRGMARRACGFFRIDDAIAIKTRASRQAWQAEMLCLGARADWLVLPEFDAISHVRAVGHNPAWPLYRAIDFGYRSPMVCLWIQVSPAGEIHVLDEYVSVRRPLAEHASEILRRDPGPVTATYVDPAGTQKEATSGAACTEMLAAAGIPCLWRTSNIAEGLELIRSALAPATTTAADGKALPPGLLVHPRCKNLIEAFQTYHYPPPESDADDRSKPVKDGPDHHIDALRYFFINRMRPAQEVKRSRY